MFGEKESKVGKKIENRQIDDDGREQQHRNKHWPVETTAHYSTRSLKQFPSSPKGVVTPMKSSTSRSSGHPNTALAPSQQNVLSAAVFYRNNNNNYSMTRRRRLPNELLLEVASSCSSHLRMDEECMPDNTAKNGPAVGPKKIAAPNGPSMKHLEGIGALGFYMAQKLKKCREAVAAAVKSAKLKTMFHCVLCSNLNILPSGQEYVSHVESSHPADYQQYLQSVHQQIQQNMHQYFQLQFHQHFMQQAQPYHLNNFLSNQPSMMQVPFHQLHHQQQQMGLLPQAHADIAGVPPQNAQSSIHFNTNAIMPLKALAQFDPYRGGYGGYGGWGHGGGYGGWGHGGGYGGWGHGGGYGGWGHGGGYGGWGHDGGYGSGYEQFVGAGCLMGRGRDGPPCHRYSPYPNHGYGTGRQPTGGGAVGGYNANIGPTKIYMRGIPFRLNAGDVERFFAPLVCVDIQVGTMPDGRSSGCGIVEFQTPTDAHQAIQKHREYIGNRYVELFSSLSARIPPHVTYNSIGGNGRRGGGGGGSGPSMPFAAQQYAQAPAHLAGIAGVPAQSAPSSTAQIDIHPSDQTDDASSIFWQGKSGLTNHEWNILKRRIEDGVCINLSQILKEFNDQRKTKNVTPMLERRSVQNVIDGENRRKRNVLKKMS